VLIAKACQHGIQPFEFGISQWFWFHKTKFVANQGRVDKGGIGNIADSENDSQASKLQAGYRGANSHHFPPP
jgi:hypothetical protein